MENMVLFFKFRIISNIIMLFCDAFKSFKNRGNNRVLQVNKAHNP